MTGPNSLLEAKDVENDADMEPNGTKIISWKSKVEKTNKYYWVTVSSFQSLFFSLTLSRFLTRTTTPATKSDHIIAQQQARAR